MIGVIGVVLQITKTIYAYGDAVLEYKNEVARLRSELFGMHAALTQIEQDLSLVGKDGRHTLASPNLKSPQFRQMLDETHTILEQLANTLQEDISRSRRLARRIIWPLKRPQMQDLARSGLGSLVVMIKDNGCLLSPPESGVGVQDDGRLIYSASIGIR